jgi:hypothetical protein
VVLGVLVDFDVALCLGLLPVGKRRDRLGLFIAHEKYEWRVSIFEVKIYIKRWMVK